MNYSEIKYYDIANGTGVRTTLFVSGCRNHCEGCFQPETWDFDDGQLFTVETENEIISSVEPDYIEGLTLLGGDPFEPENQFRLIEFLRRFRMKCPSKNIWAYTGYLLEDLMDSKKNTPVTHEMLSYIDVLVDGRFILSQKNLMLKFRGSENQRLIDMNHFRRTGEVREVML